MSIFYDPPPKKKEERVQKQYTEEKTQEQLHTYVDKMFDYDYENLSLGQIMDAYLEENQIQKTQVSISYYNFVTEETYHLNEQTIRVAASTYKLPLNIAVYDDIRNGLYTKNNTAYYPSHAAQDGKTAEMYPIGSSIPIDFLLTQSIVDSDNTAALILVEHLGGWYTFVERADALVAPTYPQDANYGNLMTSQYALALLQYLYENRSDYPELIDHLQKACPDQYAQKYIHEVDVAHKYGFYETYYHDTMIVFGSQPFAAAIFTDGLDEETVAQISRILYEYAQCHILK